MAAIFVNYRTVDESGTAKLLKRELSRAFGEDAVFLATEMIPPGRDFAVELLRRVRGCEVLLVVVGARWLTASHPSGRRAIDHEEDWVRREIAEAFACGARVVPVLVNETERLTDAELPDSIEQLTRCQFRRLRHAHAGQDLTRIVEDLVEEVPTLRRLHRRPSHLPAGSGAIPVEDAILDHGYLLATVLRNGFTGRAWVIEQIDSFLRTRPCGYVWIEGEAGVGKTALAAHLIRERGWIGHFARLPRGGSIRVGLRSLAGSLAVRYGLAEAGMLAERASTPDGFGTLLARAASRADGPVVLVLDGADEAEPIPGTQPWGLPNLLPDGVYVVGTYRTGSPPPRCDAPHAVVRIAPADPRNRSDVAEHLRSLLSPEQADALADGCGGVWIYLRYILDEIRAGLRHDLTDLPADLTAFYIAGLERWSDDPHWNDGLLLLLATLAVVGEPLSSRTLATLVAVDEQSVHRWCHTTLRPFLNATATSPRTFEIYHASLREFLTGTLPGRHASEQTWLWAETLRTAAVAAHDRIAEHLLSTVDHLRAEVPGYALRHLTRHLLAASRMADLHRLLGMTHMVGHDRVVNTWFAAHDDTDTVDDYLDDVAVTREEAELSTDLALATHQPAATLADELRCHLIVASITSRTTGIPADLLAALLRAGVWTSARALTHARRLPAPDARVVALTALLPCLSPDERAAAVEHAHASATTVADGYSRAKALIRVVAHLRAERRDLVVAEALTATVAVSREQKRAELLRELAPWLSVEQLDVALAHADAIENAVARAVALTALAPRMSTDRRPGVFVRAITAASMISGESDRARAIVDLAPHVPAQAAAVGSKITSRRHRAETLAAVAVNLSGARRAEVLRDALAAAEAVPDVTARVETLVRLTPHLAHQDDPAAVGRHAVAVVGLVAGIADEKRRAEILAALLPRLPASHVDSALEAALAATRAVRPGEARAELLVRLARHSPAVTAEAFAAVLTVRPQRSRTVLWTALAAHLSPPQQRNALTEALAAAQTIASDFERIAELVDVPQPRFAADSATTEHDRADIDREPAACLTEALAVAATASTAAIAQLDGPRPADTVADAMTIPDPHARVRRLARLAPFLPPETRADVMAQQLSLLVGTPDDDARARSLAAVVPHLPANHIDLALALAAASSTDVSRALTRLIPLLTTASQLSRTLDLIPDQDRTMLCALLTRAGEVLEIGPEYVALLRRTLSPVGRDTCLALLAIAVPRLREIADADFDARTWAALRDVHQWWP